MSFSEGGRRIFQVSSAIAAFGLMSLILQTLLAKLKKRKRQTKVDSPVTLSAGTSGDELQKPATAYGGSAGHARAEPDEAWERPLHDRISALMSQASLSPGADDTTLEIARAAAIYLEAAHDLLRLRHGGFGEGRARRTLAELHAAAGLVVRNTTAATASLRDLRPLERPTPAAAQAELTGLLSFLALLIALVAVPVARPPLPVVVLVAFGFPAILAMMILASTSSTKAELEGTMDDVDKKA